MSNKPMMSEEQWSALRGFIMEVAASGPEVHMMFLRTHDEARRLLVEPEQSTAKQSRHYGDCKGGPLDMARVGSDDEILPVPGGEYHWSGFAQDWHWVPDVDPDLTTFGELKAGERYVLIEPLHDESGPFLRTDWEDESVLLRTGEVWCNAPDCEVKRIPE